MKLLFIADPHLGARKNSSVFIKITEEFFNITVPSIIDEHHIDQLWILGDLFEDRHELDTRIKLLAFNIFENLLNKFNDLKINIITGNHDIYYKNSLDTTTLKMFFEYSNRIHVVRTVEEYSVGGCSVIAFPWIWDTSEGFKKLKELYDVYEDTGKKQYDLCLGHFEINGGEVTPGTVMKSNISQKYFSAFKHVYSGHFHIRQQLGNIKYCGSPYEITWNDYDDIKGCYVFDTITQKSTFIENTSSPKHIKLKLSDILEDKSIIKHIKNSWVKLFIDTPIKDDNRIELLTVIDAYSPIELTIIDEVEGSEIYDDTIDLDYTEYEGNELTYLNEYTSQLEFDIPKEDIVNYAQELYDRCLQENEG